MRALQKFLKIGIPSDWESPKLKALCDFNYGIPLAESQRIQGPYPVYGSNGIVGWHEDYFIEGPGIVIGRKGTAGEVTWVNGNFTSIDTTFYITLNDKAMSLKYLFFLMQFCEFDRFTGATGVPGLSRNDAYSLIIPKPPKPEQTAIATILSKVDDAIEATQNTIKAAEKIKKALMQNLLTGKLKPDGTWRSEAEFNFDVKFGSYPSDWNFSKFKDYAILQRGKDLTDNDVIEGIYPVVKSNGIQIHHHQYFVEPPGVVTGRSGTIGKAFYIEEKFWAHNTTLYVKDFKGNCPKFMYYLILRMDFRKYYAGTTIPTLNRNDIHRLKIAIPKTFEEQKAISDLIDSSDYKIANKQIKIQILQRLKKSLMQHLLTGKVRVDVEKINNILKEQEE